MPQNYSYLIAEKTNVVNAYKINLNTMIFNINLTDHFPATV